MRVLPFILTAAFFSFLFLLPAESSAEGPGKSEVHKNAQAEEHEPEKKGHDSDSGNASETHEEQQQEETPVEDKTVPGKGKGLDHTAQVQNSNPAEKDHSDRESTNNGRHHENQAAKDKPDKTLPVQASGVQNKPQQKTEESVQKHVKLEDSLREGARNDATQSTQPDSDTNDSSVETVENNIEESKVKIFREWDKPLQRFPFHREQDGHTTHTPAAIAPSQASGSVSSLMTNGHSGTGNVSVFAVLEHETDRKNVSLAPHVSRFKDFRNQWVNAPPSPPPKYTSSFKTHQVI